MPYSLPTQSMGRAGHRRSYSDTPGSGTFSPMGTLPRRRPTVFHFRDDDSSPSDSDDDRPVHPPLRLKTPAPPRMTRTNSTPILLSNGKPLKSSLKSSSSTLTIQSPPSNHLRLRAASHPNTPLSVPPPKNVHFPSTGSDLATVRIYSRSARPASISLPIEGQGDTETETESERTPASLPFPRFPVTPRKPFAARMTTTKTVHALDPTQSSQIPAPAPPPHANVHLESLLLHSSSSPSLSLSLRGTLLVRNLAYEKTVAVRFTLDEWDTTSEVTARYVASLPALPPALYVPGSGLSPTSSWDDLQSACPATGAADPKWDRFAFTIRLDDYAPSLAARTLWLVARYSTPTVPPAGPPETPLQLEDRAPAPAGANEWWDNNGGRNYRVGFCLRETMEDAYSSEEGEEKVRTPIVPPIRILTTPSTAPPSFPTSTSPPFSSTPPGSGVFSTHTYAFPSAHPALTRLRALSLKNYAAPAPVVSPSSSSPGPHPSPFPAHVRERTPSLLSEDSAEGSPPLTTPTDPASPLPPLPGIGMKMEGGFPATAFGAVKQNEKGEEREEHPTSGSGEAAGIELYWPWARSAPAPASVPTLPPVTTKPQQQPPEQLPHRARARPLSPPLSDSSSSSSSSSERPHAHAQKQHKPRLGRRVFHTHTATPPPLSPPIRITSPSSSSSATPTPTPTPTLTPKPKPAQQTPSPMLSPALPPPPPGSPALGAGTGGEETDADRIYQALVRKWCFAAAPAAAGVVR